MMLKKFWKELVFVILFTILLMTLSDYIPINSSKEAIFSTQTYVIGIIVLILPIIPATIAGYLISKQSYHKTHSLLIPGFGTAIGMIILLTISFGQLYFLTDTQWQTEYQKVDELGINLFDNMSLNEFKDFTINSVLIAIPFITLLNFGFGVVGGLIGNYVYSKKNH